MGRDEPFRQNQPQHVGTRSVALPVQMNYARLLGPFTRDLVDELYRPGHQYRRAGVTCENLSLEENMIGNLFEQPDRRRPT